MAIILGLLISIVSGILLVITVAVIIMLLSDGVHCTIKKHKDGATISMRTGVQWVKYTATSSGDTYQVLFTWCEEELKQIKSLLPCSMKTRKNIQRRFVEHLSKNYPNIHIVEIETGV